jgi:ribosomal protein L11 methyltransferase
MGEEDWANNWKQHFPPLRIGKRFVIKPTWEDFAPQPADILIELDPGLAFGTGTQPTTRMCLEMLEGIIYGDPPFLPPVAVETQTLLDVGTGSGILSIAAAKCGVTGINAIDIDQRAVSVTAENLALNQVARYVSVSDTPLDCVTGTFGIVVANIIAEELVKLSLQLVEKVIPGGHLILSGILAEREDFVRTGFSPYPVDLVTVRRDEEWCCLCYRILP